MAMGNIFGFIKVCVLKFLNTVLNDFAYKSQ